MSGKSSDKTAIVMLAGFFAVFAFLRLFGGSIFGNHWSFTHFDYIADWYPFVWAAVTLGLTYFLWNYSGKLAALIDSRLKIKLVLSALLLSFALFYLDSFLFGGGNLRVAQIAQSEKLILRWFEFGSIGLVGALYSIVSILGLSGDSGGVLAWRLFAFASSGAAIIGMARLSSLLSDNRQRQILLFLMGLFGSQTILYFGFIGVETAVVPVTIWFAFYALRTSRLHSSKDLAMVWLVTIIGLLMHISLAFLLPAVAYLSVVSLIRHRFSNAAAATVAAMTFAGLLHLVYRVGINSMEFSEQVLGLSGKLPFSDYGLFSVRHIGDMIGLMFLVAPMALFAKMILFAHRQWAKLNIETIVFWLMSLGGTIVLLISDPVNSIVLDLPRLAAYLTPYSLLLALVLSDRSKEPPSTRFLAVVASLSIAIALSYLPTYRYISAAEQYVTAYSEQFPSFWRTTVVSLRDSYYHNRDMDKANEWDLSLPVKSTDYLALRGSNDLIAARNYRDAIEVLYRLVATNPYWVEPRSMLAATQLRLGRNELAKPHIDTTLMLRPYIVQHHLNLYNYYKNKQQMGKAIDAIGHARQSLPKNLQLIASLMAARYMNREMNAADSLAKFLMVADSTMPDAFMIKGLIEDGRGNLEEAVTYYRKFVLMAPTDPDQPAAQKRLNEIVLQLKRLK